MTSSTSADSWRREQRGGGDGEAKRDVGIVSAFYWNTAAELDNCSKRLLVASEERKGRQVLRQMRWEKSKTTG